MRRRRVGLGLLGVAALLALVLVRVLLESRAELAAGEAALARGRPDEAIEHLRRAARWYAPGSPFVGRALGRLEELGRAAERAGERRRALAAWGAVRSALLSARSFYTPHPARLRRADERLAALLAEEEERPDAPWAREPRAARRAFHLGLLRRDDAPRAGWTALALLGAASLVGGALLFIHRAIGADDRLRRRPALASLLLVVGGLVAFVAGLRLA